MRLLISRLRSRAPRRAVQFELLFLRRLGVLGSNDDLAADL